MANRFVPNETSCHGKGTILEIANEVTDVLDNAGIAYEIFSHSRHTMTHAVREI